MRIIDWNNLIPIKTTKQYKFKFVEVYHIKFISLQNEYINQFNFINTGSKHYYYSYNINIQELTNINIQECCIFYCILLNTPNTCFCIFTNQYYTHILSGKLTIDKYIIKSNININKYLQCGDIQNYDGLTLNIDKKYLHFLINIRATQLLLKELKEK